MVRGGQLEPELLGAQIPALPLIISLIWGTLLNLSEPQVPYLLLSEAFTSLSSKGCGEELLSWYRSRAKKNERLAPGLCWVLAFVVLGLACYFHQLEPPSYTDTPKPLPQTLEAFWATHVPGFSIPSGGGWGGERWSLSPPLTQYAIGI